MIAFRCLKQDIYVVQFGLGLVGSSIHNVFKFNNDVSNKIAIDLIWTSKNEQILALKELSVYLQKQHSISNIHIIWSAGKCGFSASLSEIEDEKETFIFIVKKIDELINQLNLSGVTTWHLMSSAGGLYEGLINVDLDTLCQIKRPYGDLKMQQEKVLKGLSNLSSLNIYRLSSVYSDYNLSDRLGLLGTLVKNGLTSKVTSIFGSEMTLRDYVNDNDIANYLYNRIVYEKLRSETSIQIIASGRPYSIYHIKSIIEEKINMPLFLKYSLVNFNADNITFNPSCLPKGLRCKTLNTSIQNIINSFFN